MLEVVRDVVGLKAVLEIIIIDSLQWITFFLNKISRKEINETLKVLERNFAIS